MKLLTDTKAKRRLKIAYYLTAAHHYDMTLLHRACMRESTWEEAEEISEFINFLIRDKWEKTTPSEFMRPLEEDANRAIEESSTYLKLRDANFYDKRSIESFAKWYAASLWESASIKCNYYYIEIIAGNLLMLCSGKITQQEYNEYMNNIKSIQNPFFHYNPREVMRAFIYAMHKVKEITEKIELRNKSM